MACFRKRINAEYYELREVSHVGNLRQSEAEGFRYSRLVTPNDSDSQCEGCYYLKGLGRLAIQS